MLTLAEENYIKCIYKLSENGSRSVTTNEISDRLQTKPASVSDMLKKLAAKNLLCYERYHGVRLREEGITYASSIIRKHRLWEVFLVEKLNFKWSEVHEVAEQLEHIKSNLLIERLDAFLQYPKYDPHGGYIPDAEGKWLEDQSFALTEGIVGASYVLVRVEGGDDLLKHLDAIHMKIGSLISINNKRDFDGLFTVVLERDRIEVISKNVAQYLHVIKYEK